MPVSSALRPVQVVAFVEDRSPPNVDSPHGGQQFDPLLLHEPPCPAQRLACLAQVAALGLHPNLERHGRQRRVDVAGGPADTGGFRQGPVSRRQISRGPEGIAQDDGGEGAKAPFFLWDKGESTPGELCRLRRSPPLQDISRPPSALRAYFVPSYGKGYRAGYPSSPPPYTTAPKTRIGVALARPCPRPAGAEVYVRA